MLLLHVSQTIKTLRRFELGELVAAVVVVVVADVVVVVVVAAH